jgi:hypothetical protein
MKKQSIRARTTILVCVVAIMLVALFHASTWRDSRFFQAETFATSSQVNISTVKSMKSDRYWDAGMKYFYSDGKMILSNGMTATNSNGDMFFTPSRNDMVCKLGSQEMLSGCDILRARVDTVSRRDTTTLVSPVYDCTRSVEGTTKQPLDLQDCEVRILNNMYTFSKMCISVNVMIGVSDASGNETLLLDPQDYGAQMLVLTRPIFISGPMCALAAPLDMQQIVFDSTSNTPYPLRIKKVNDNSIWDTSKPGTSFLHFIKTVMSASNSSTDIMASKNADQKARTTPMAVPITLYYLNYSKGPGKSMPENASNNVLTLYIPVYTDSVGPMFKSPAFSVSLVGTKFTVTPRNSSPLVVEAPTNGHIVMTYTTTLLIVATMSRNRMAIRHFTSLPYLKVTGTDVQSARAMHPATAAVFPYTNTCIPNFADVAIKMGYR